MNKQLALFVLLALLAGASQAQGPLGYAPAQPDFRPNPNVEFRPTVAPQTVMGQPDNAAPGDDLAARMARLEAENQRMQAELQRMREATGRAPASGTHAIPASMEMADPAPGEAGPPGVTMAQVDAEVKRLMWTKGDFRIVPYGWLWGNAVESTQRTNPGSFTLWVLSRTSQPEGEGIVDARNTRLGLDVLGPRIPLLACAQSGGKVEIDFQNGSVVGNTENKGYLLLRHAYLEVKNEDFRLLAGQTWDVISPLLPGMIMYSVGWDGGNIGYRRAQFRAERYLALSDVSLVTLQGSINQNVFTDTFSPNIGGTAYTLRGEPSGWPIVEGRLGWTVGQRTGRDALPITFGVSGHVGQTEFDLVQANGALFAPFRNSLRNTWSLNADLRIPITQRFGFQAEFFTGENLGPFLGAIGQGLDPVTLEGIHSTGGWGEFWYDLTPRLHTHFGYSVDDPDNAEMHSASGRTYNQFFFTNLIYDVTRQFTAGVEVSSWKTLYVNQLPGESVRFEFVARYGF
jgi:hypothetical protein